MIDINTTKTRNTAQKGVHYMPTMRLRDNKRIGYSYASNGSTEAKGTLYPSNMNNTSGVGSLQSMYDTEHTTAGEFSYDTESFTNNEIKYKTAENYFQNYKKLKKISIGFLQSKLAIASSSVFNTSGQIEVNKVFAISTTGFFFIFRQAGTTGIYACAGTINATTGALTFGTPVSLSTVVTQSFGGVDCVEISTAKFAIVFQQTATTMRNIICTVSGAVVTAGTAVDNAITSSTVGNSYVNMAKVDTDKYMTTYYSSALSKCYTWVTTVSGTVPTNGSVTDAFAAANRQNSLITMSTTSAGMLIANSGTNRGYAQAFTISGTTVTYGTEVLMFDTNDISIFNGGNYQCHFVSTGANAYYFLSTLSDSGMAEYYLTVSGTVTTIALRRTGVMTSGAYTDFTRTYALSATQWGYYTVLSTVCYLITFEYDATTGLMSIIRRTPLSNNEVATLNLSRIGIAKIGSQFLMLATVSSNTTSIYASVGQVGSCEIYFEADVSASATLTNPTWGWAYTYQTVNKAIGRTIAYFSMKNVTGNTTTIKTLDWLFEID